VLHVFGVQVLQKCRTARRTAQGNASQHPAHMRDTLLHCEWATQ